MTTAADIPEDLVLEQIFVCDSGIDRINKELARLKDEFEMRDDVCDLRAQASDLADIRRGLVLRADERGIVRQGRYSLRHILRNERRVIPQKFAAKFGLPLFVRIASVRVGDAEAAVAELIGEKTGRKAKKTDIAEQLDECCAITTVDRGVEVHVDLAEGGAE